ncbi:MAG: 2-nitropropane dioxygenase [Caedibacter sp. 37-49]|nr:MAG: 2-nitropropane dioxygenase [Caedibacter sp. 37-49]
MQAYSYLDSLWHRGKEFLGVEVPILAGAMTWVSDRHLVSAISNAGGFGVIACGAMEPHHLDHEISETKKLTTRPFGVNLITLHPDLNKLIEVCIQHHVSHIILAGGLPNAESIKMVKNAGIKMVCFAPALALAKRLIRMGVDALVIEGHEAGGHIGPVTTSVLAQEIIPALKEVPIFVAGGIGRGEAILSYLEMGASGCQLGTRFVCATECRAHPRFKQAFIRASSRDAVISPQLDARFPVIPVRALENEGTQKFVEFQQQTIDQVNRGEVELKEGQLQIEKYWAGALRRAVVDGDVETGSVMAGQSVGLVNKEQPAKEIIDELIAQAITTIEMRNKVKVS